MKLTLSLSVITLVLSTFVQAQNSSPYWSLSGNSNASTSSKLGTTNAVPLRLYTKNSERLRIDTLGKVGIGSTNPGARLTVNAPTGMVPLVVQANGTTKLYLSGNGGLSVGGSSAPPTNGLYVSGNAGFGTAKPTAKLHVVGNGVFTGNVGIGTSTPTSKLQVVGNTSLSGNLGLSNGDVTINGNLTIGLDANENYTQVEVEGFGHFLRGISAGSDGGIAIYGATNGRAGVYGQGNPGVVGDGESIGVSGSGHIYGVYGKGGDYGVYGYAYSGGNGIYGKSDDEYTYGGLFESTNGIGLSASTTNGVYAAQFNGKVYLSAGYTTSDKNLKQNIEEFNGAMDIIGKLKPRYYEFKTDKKYAFLHLEKGKHYGLLAQDVEEVLPNLISTATHKNIKTPALPDSNGRIKPDSSLQNAKAESISIKAVNYTELIPIIIKGMQEQEAADKVKDTKIANLEAEVAELRRIVMELKGSSGIVTTTSAYLEQNTPNPVSGTTIIGYYIPKSTRSASITITNAKGQLIKSISISNKGIGQISLNTTMLASGTYNYTLYADGKQADSKRFIITK